MQDSKDWRMGDLLKAASDAYEVLITVDRTSLINKTLPV